MNKHIDKQRGCLLGLAIGDALGAAVEFKSPGSFAPVGVPHQVTGGSALNQVPELTLLVKCLNALVEPENSVALVAVLRSELFGLGEDSRIERHSRTGCLSEQLTYSPTPLPDCRVMPNG